MNGNTIPGNYLISFLKKILSVPENKSRIIDPPEKILVVRQHNQFGDLLAGVSLFRAIKEKYPDSGITVVTSLENYYGAVKNKYIDELYVFNKSSLLNPFKIISFLRFLRQPFDLVIVPVTVSVSFTSNLIARLSNSRVRIGPNSLDGVPNPSSFLFDRRVDIDWRKYPDSNVAEHILEIIRPFGMDTRDFSSEISFDESDKRTAMGFLSGINYSGDTKLIGMHVGAGKPPNRWSLDKYVRLISLLNESYHCRFYLTGTDSDNDEIEYVRMHSAVKLSRFINKPIPAVAALISLSDLFISNDTGIMHVAGTTKTPLISLFGPTNPFNWAPCGDNKIFIRRSELIDDIEVDDVLKLCLDILGNNGRR